MDAIFEARQSRRDSKTALSENIQDEKETALVWFQAGNRAASNSPNQSV